MTTIKWTESEFAMQALSDLDLLDPANRLKKPELVERIMPVLLSDHLVTELSTAEVQKKSFHQAQGPVLFFGLSGDNYRIPEDGGSEETVQGMEALASIIWTATSESGLVQQSLPHHHLLCRANVKRNVSDTTGLTPVMISSTFVTDQASVANAYYTTKVTGSLVRKAESITKQLDLLVERMPENKETVAAMLSPAVQEAVHKLSQITEQAGLKLGVTADGKLALTGAKKKDS